MVNTILMDLDGTLLPFEQEEFIQAYFSRLCKAAAPFGIEPKPMVKAVWAGTKAMMQNDGRIANRDRFWLTFAPLIGETAAMDEAAPFGHQAVLSEKLAALETTFDAFYGGAFDEVKEVLRGETPAADIVRTLKEKGYTVALATNPLFPPPGVRTRLAWAGLAPEEFALVTNYENSRFCKPNTAYFRDILASLGKTPEECLMAGNNVAEDMVAGKLGLETYLVTDHIENEAGEDVARYRRGSLADFAAFCKALPAIG